MLLVSNIRRSDLTERLKIIYQDKFALLETRGTQKSNDNDAVSATSMAYLVTVSYEATDRAPRRSSSQPRSSRVYHISIVILGRDGISFRCTAGEWPWNERAPLPSLEMALE